MPKLFPRAIYTVTWGQNSYKLYAIHANKNKWPLSLAAWAPATPCNTVINNGFYTASPATPTVSIKR